MALENQYTDDLSFMDHSENLQRPQQGAPLHAPWSSTATLAEISTFIRPHAPDAVVTSMGYGADLYTIVVQVPEHQASEVSKRFGPHILVQVMQDSAERTVHAFQQLTQQTFHERIAEAFPHMLHRVQHEELGWEGEVGHQRVMAVQGEYVQRVRDSFPGEHVRALTREEYSSALYQLPRAEFDRHMHMLVDERMSILLPGVRFRVGVVGGSITGSFGLKLRIAVPAEHVEDARRLFPREEVTALTQDEYHALYPESVQNVAAEEPMEINVQTFVEPHMAPDAVPAGAA